MTKTGYKNIFIALLLLAFTCQSFAALVMSCQFESQMSHSMNMDYMAEMDHANMARMDHSEMAGDLKTDTTTSDDCCKAMGHCLSGGCSLANLENNFALSFAVLSSDAARLYISVLPSPLISSLYRPPIFR